jgi:hypothetical protein
MNNLTQLIHQRLDVGKNRPEPPYHGMNNTSCMAEQIKLIIDKYGINTKYNKRVPGLLKTTPKLVEGAVESSQFGMIYGEVDQSIRDDIVRLETSPDNMYGANIKCIMISKTGAEGLDLKYIREVHIIEPYWDQARSDQVKYRAIRMGSHDGLPLEEKTVKTFIYCATANPVIPTKLEKETIDQSFYRKAQEKYVLIEEFRKLLAEVSIECSVMKHAVCKTCSPDNVPLFTKDPLADIRATDPCMKNDKKEVTAESLIYEDKTYYYTINDTSVYGYTFYMYDNSIDSYVPIDESEPIIGKLLKVLGKLTA